MPNERRQPNYFREAGLNALNAGTLPVLEWLVAHHLFVLPSKTRLQNILRHMPLTSLMFLNAHHPGTIPETLSRSVWLAVLSQSRYEALFWLLDTFPPESDLDLIFRAGLRPSPSDRFIVINGLLSRGRSPSVQGAARLLLFLDYSSFELLLAAGFVPDQALYVKLCEMQCPPPALEWLEGRFGLRLDIDSARNCLIASIKNAYTNTMELTEWLLSRHQPFSNEILSTALDQLVLSARKTLPIIRLVLAQGGLPSPRTVAMAAAMLKEDCLQLLFPLIPPESLTKALWPMLQRRSNLARSALENLFRVGWTWRENDSRALMRIEMPAELVRWLLDGRISVEAVPFQFVVEKGTPSLVAKIVEKHVPDVDWDDVIEAATRNRDHVRPPPPPSTTSS